MADRIAMRVIRAGTNSEGSHRIGDVITVDEPHAALFEIVGFAERMPEPHEATVTRPSRRWPTRRAT